MSSDSFVPLLFGRLNEDGLDERGEGELRIGSDKLSAT